jgi:hypothetical protein
MINFGNIVYDLGHQFRGYLHYRFGNIFCQSIALDNPLNVAQSPFSLQSIPNNCCVKLIVLAHQKTVCFDGKWSIKPSLYRIFVDKYALHSGTFCRILGGHFLLQIQQCEISRNLQNSKRLTSPF